MSIYTYNIRIVGSGDSGTFEVTSTIVQSGALEDFTDDGDFVLNEAISVTPSGGSASSNWEFFGTYDAGNGNILVVLENTLIPQVYTVFGNVSDPATFSLANFPLSSVDSSAFTVCFAAGTLIATPKGEAAVETLQIGDLIRTADGRSVPVKWIGRQTVQKLFAGERARPVRVAAGALGCGLPHTDLVLTADHALILDGFAINAGALVNGTTITLEPLASLPDRVTYYHVETEDHDIILANGTPAETFVDYVGRQAFDNHAEYAELYGDERIIAEMPLPRISTARLVPPALRNRLSGDAAA
jgi:hypothetical protein